MNNEIISDEVPPMYSAFQFIGSLMLQSEIGVIPLCGDGDGEFFTFGSVAKASQLSKIPEMIHISQVREIMRVSPVAQVIKVAQVAPVVKVKALEKVEGVTDDAYLHMTVPEFNNYAKKLGLNDHQKSILVLARRRMNNRGYSKTARLKRKNNKNNESNTQNIIKNDAKMPSYSVVE